MEASQVQFTDEEQAGINRFLAKYGSWIAERGVNASMYDDGITLLHCAAMSNDAVYGVLITKYLVSVGANIHAKSDNGCTPLHFAAIYGGSIKTVQFLVSVGADVNVQAFCGDTPLDYVKGLNDFGYAKEETESKNNMKIIEYLESIGAKSGSEAS